MFCLKISESLHLGMFRWLHVWMCCAVLAIETGGLCEEEEADLWPSVTYQELPLQITTAL